MSIDIKKCDKRTIDLKSLTKYDFKVAKICFNLWLSEHIVEKNLSEEEGSILQSAFLCGFASKDAQILQADWIEKTIERWRAEKNKNN